MSTPLVIGLDLSLNSAGIAGADWADALRPHRDSNGHPRLEWLRTEINDRCKHADLVVVEGPSYGNAAQQGYHEMAGLWWTITHDLWRKNIPVAVATPHSRTIYATGKARHRGEDGTWLKALQVKGLVRAEAVKRYGVDCDGPGRYDKADALVLAHMGLARLGYPAVADLPPTHTRALATMTWPEQNLVVAAA